MRKNYTKRQITEAIRHWERVLECECAFDLAKSRCVNESVSSDDLDKVKEEVKSQIQTPEDVKDFIEANDEKVQQSRFPELIKAWDKMKSIVSAGISTTATIIKHWSMFMLVIAAALVYIKGPGWCAAQAIKLFLKLVAWLTATGVKNAATFDAGTPRAIRSMADGNGGLNAFFDPGGWN